MPETAHAPLVRFARELRDAGVSLGSGQVTRYCEAVTTLGPRDLDDLYWAGRTTLVSRAADLPTYDAVFAAVFKAERPRSPHAPSVPRLDLRETLVDDATPTQSGDGDAPVTVGAVASEVEVLRHKRFADMTEEERTTVRRLIAAIRLHPPSRRSRRTRPSRRGRTPDLRRSLRRALRTHGEIVDRSWRTRRTRPRRLVLLLDVSGSMSEYALALVTFAHAVARSGVAVEAFCFGTRITRVTRAVRGRDPEESLRATADEVADWDGGTRIGASLAEFRRRWGKSGLSRGAIVVICSDGLERGEPDVLAAEMQRLARLAHLVVWVNPLKGDPRYQPLARGMAAALPSIDIFRPGHNLTSLEGLAKVFAELT